MIVQEVENVGVPRPVTELGRDMLGELGEGRGIEMRSMETEAHPLINDSGNVKRGLLEVSGHGSDELSRAFKGECCRLSERSGRTGRPWFNVEGGSGWYGGRGSFKTSGIEESFEVCGECSDFIVMLGRSCSMLSALWAGSGNAGDSPLLPGSISLGL